MPKMLNWNALRTRIGAGAASAKARAVQGRDWIRRNDPVYAAVRRPGPAEWWAGGLTLFLIAVVLIFLAWFDWNRLRGPIGRWASAEYHRAQAHPAFQASAGVTWSRPWRGCLGTPPRRSQASRRSRTSAPFALGRGRPPF